MDKKIVAVFFILSLYLKAQVPLVPFPGGGFQAGICLSAGSHLLRTGIWVHGYYVRDVFEGKTEVRFYMNYKSWGPGGSFFELQFSPAIQVGFDEKDSTFFSPFFFIYSPHTGRKSHVGYAMNFYWDSRRTSQRTGTIWFNTGFFTFFSENDLLAQRMLDRYRTGSFGLSWRYLVWEWAITSVLWTGKWGSVLRTDHPHFRLGCYLDTTGGIFTRYSHGILLIKANYSGLSGLYGQTISAAAGIDAERIRDCMQNKLIHDMVFLPRSWLKKSRNCHIPMLDENGNPYVFRNDQKIKKSKIFLNAGLNEPIFY